MKLATALFLPLLSGLLMTVAVSAHDKEHCKLKDHKHHHHKHHKHAHHAHHKHHHHHHHHHHNHTSPPSHVPGKKCGGSLSPGGMKAGVSGQAADKFLKSHISWVNNWEAKPYDNIPNGITYVPECYGYNWSGHDLDYKRFEQFKKLNPGDHCYIIGGNELDFKGAESAGLIPPKEAAKLWDQYIAPHARAGAVTISPSCAKQRDEDWMGPFLDAVQTKPDVVNVHLFSDKVEDITKVIEHYAKYGYPMWITEFACINFNTQHFCTQQETNDFIWNAIRIFESDDRIKAYSYADAHNGDHCELTTGDGQLSESGKTYLAALEKFGKGGNKMRRSTVASIDGGLLELEA